MKSKTLPPAYVDERGLTVDSCPGITSPSGMVYCIKYLCFKIIFKKSRLIMQVVEIFHLIRCTAVK